MLLNYLHKAVSYTRLFGPSSPLLSSITKNFHAIAYNDTTTSPVGGMFTIGIRNIIRNHFPRPCEKKRVKRHGWKKRMSTQAGRRIVMNRILKGKHALTH